jgi:hypothetical protein
MTTARRADSRMKSTRSRFQDLVLEPRRQGNDARFALVFLQKGETSLIGASRDELTSQARQEEEERRNQLHVGGARLVYNSKKDANESND